MQESGLWRQLTALKPAVCEPRGTGEEFEKVMASYYDNIKKGAGGIFFAICRGKVRLSYLVKDLGRPVVDVKINTFS